MNLALPRRPRKGSIGDGPMHAMVDLARVAEEIDRPAVAEWLAAGGRMVTCGQLAFRNERDTPVVDFAPPVCEVALDLCATTDQHAAMGSQDCGD